jgi:4-hydroxy-tetrahydrodipicolinate synthase
MNRLDLHFQFWRENVMSPFEGIWVPIVTPFRDGSVDLDGAQRLAVDLAADGVSGIVVCGTTGEAASLDESEQAALLQAVIEAIGPRCPVAMGIAGNNTRALIEKVGRYNHFEPAAYLISAPSYVKPSQQGILLHYQSIASNTDVPIIVYNIPARTGVNIDADTVIALSADPQFVAIKESSGNVPQMGDILNRTSLKLLAGDDALLLATLDLGGHGAISASAHLRPDLFVRIVQLMRSGQVEQASAIFDTLQPLIKLLFSEPNPAPIKAALAMQGRIRDGLRLPMTPMSSAGREKLAAVLDQLTVLTAKI